MKNFSRVRAAWILLSAVLVFGCERRSPPGWQGYLEGEFVYISAPLAGRLEQLAVQKGTRIEAGTPLFTLEQVSEQAGQREAADRLRAAQARLEDLRKGARPSELAAAEAQLEQARAAAELSQRELTRQSELFKSGAVAAGEFDRARVAHERNERAIEELAARLATARLGARSDAIAAAEADVAAASAVKARADWAVTQKTHSSPYAALVYDTLFRAGEFVPAGAPVVALLPPANLKVRFFVPEAEFAALKAGDTVRISISGHPAPVDAQVSYLSPRPEYTPPVLYNRENRSKLVFMVEALLPPGIARDWHPGQPVDVTRVP